MDDRFFTELRDCAAELGRIIEAVTAAGRDPVWALIGIGPASFWGRRRKADVAVHGPAAKLLLVLTRRLPPSDPAVEVLGEQALLTHWLQNTPY